MKSFLIQILVTDPKRCENHGGLRPNQPFWAPASAQLSASGRATHQPSKSVAPAAETSLKGELE